MMGCRPAASSGDYWSPAGACRRAGRRPDPLAGDDGPMTAETNAAESILAKRTRGDRRQHFGGTNPRRPQIAFWRNEPETISAVAVAEKPQPHHRIGPNPVDGLTLTIAGAKRSRAWRIRET